MPFCWVKHGRQCRDSEWHAFFDCHVCLAPRRRFQLALLSLNSSVIFFDKNRAGRIAIVSDLVNLVIQCREHRDVISEFTRFVVDLVACRQRAFRSLSVRDLRL